MPTNTPTTRTTVARLWSRKICCVSQIVFVLGLMLTAIGLILKAGESDYMHMVYGDIEHFRLVTALLVIGAVITVIGCAGMCVGSRVAKKADEVNLMQNSVPDS